MNDLEEARSRMQKAFDEVTRAKWHMKECDRRRFTLAFGSAERATAEDFYEQAKREHADAVAYFHSLSKEFDDTRMRAHAGKR